MNQRRPNHGGSFKNTAKTLQNANRLQTKHVLSSTTENIPRGPCNIAGRLTAPTTTTQERPLQNTTTMAAKQQLTSRVPLGRVQPNIQSKQGQLYRSHADRKQEANSDPFLKPVQQKSKIPQLSGRKQHSKSTPETLLEPSDARRDQKIRREKIRERAPLFKSFGDPMLTVLPHGVRDADCERTAENGGMDTVAEGFFYMMWVERQRPISDQFPYTFPDTPLQPSRQTRSSRLVDERMRIILVDWMLGCAQKLGLRQLTKYLGIWILDKFIDECNSPSRREQCLLRMSDSTSVDSSVKANLSPIYVHKQNLQLIGVTAMVIATKYEEIHFPILEDWVYLSAESLQRSQIIEMEIRILRALNFDLSMPSPIEFLRRFSKIANADQKMHIIAKFCIETSLYSTNLTKTPGSVRAAAALYIALRLTDRSRKGVWTKELSFYSQIWSSDTVTSSIGPRKDIFVEQKGVEDGRQLFYQTVAEIAYWIIKTVSDNLPKDKKKVKASAVFKKYSSSDNMNIALDSALFGCRLSSVDRIPPGESTKDAHIKVLETGNIIRVNPILRRFADRNFEYT